MDGKVEVEVPANVINESLEFDIREPAPNTQPGVSLTWQPVEIIAVGKSSLKNIHQFKTPIKIKIKYDETQIFGWDEDVLMIFYYDPDLYDWFPIQTTVDTENNILTAYSDHLTVFDYRAGNWQSQMLPTIDAFKTSDFTGAGTYTMNLWTPPAPGGLQPSLALSYNSQVIDESSAFSQASWVGMGWSLDTGSITRNMHGTDTENGTDWNDDTYSISAAGISGLLLPISKSGSKTTYNTSDQSFMKVIEDSDAYSFTAWTKDGTKYVFGHLTGTNLSNSCAPSGSTPTTWRYSLSSVTDIHGNTLTYSYTNDAKPGCANQIAVYPNSIAYGNGKYQIVFIREARTDYQTSWTVQTARTFYGTQRLKEVQIQHNGATVKSYVFSYAPNNGTNIYPNFTWSKGGKTLTLVGVQEFGSDGSALPAIQFTYGDYMHLTKVNNGQGGIVQMAYKRWTYFDDVNNDMRDLKTIFGQYGHDCYSSLGTQWARVGTAGTVRCDPVVHYLQVGNTSNEYTVAERPLPEHMVKPGAYYWFYIKGLTVNTTSTSPIYGFRDTGTNQSTVVTSKVAFNNSGSQEVDEQGIEMPIDYDPADTKLRLECRNCFFSQVEFILWPLMYRVVTKTVSVQPTSDVASYSYSYDNASPNSKDNSADALADETDTDDLDPKELYTKVLREFRGHAMTQVVNPQGLATVNWFYQTDNLKGRAYQTFVIKQDVYEDFGDEDDLAYIDGKWDFTGGTLDLTQVYEKDFDNAAKLFVNSSTNWGKFERTSASLTSGEIAFAQFRLSGTNAQGKVGLVNGGQFVGVNVNIGGNNKVVIDNGGTNGATLISNFKKDEWYGIMILLDVTNGTRVRVWQLDDPSTMTGGLVNGVGSGSWKFQESVVNGTIWLDAYMEGIPYSETRTGYTSTVQYDTIPNNGISDLLSLKTFRDLKIAWNSVAWTEQRNYFGASKWVGTRQVFTYDSGKVGSGHYGNMLTQIEYTGDITWKAYRGAKIDYAMPNSTLYIVGLPERKITLDCRTTCDFTSLAGKVAESIFLYDGNTTYPSTTAPTTGDVTRQRVWVRGADYSQASFNYYSNGNLKDQIVYLGYATAAQTGNPTGQRITRTTYDTDGYNTYPVSVSYATGLPVATVTQTEYDYSLGLPKKVTSPNGMVTSATYDGFGRLKTITAQPDSSPTLQVTYYDAKIPFQVDLKQSVNAGASIRLSRFYDGVGRQIQTQTVGSVVATESGVQTKNVAVDYNYNNLGRLVEQSVPRPIDYDDAPQFISQDFTHSTVTSYDILGRPSRVTQPNQNFVKYTYGALTTTITDSTEFANSTTSTMDVWGHTTKVTPPTGPSIGYIYDVAGQLTKAIRAAASEVDTCLNSSDPNTGCPGDKTVSIQYDNSGRKISMNDPDMGSWAYDYDAMGNLTFQSDNQSCELSLGYDGLNRLKNKTFGGSCDDEPDINYYYDSDVPSTSDYDPAQTNQKGSRTYMIDPSGSTAWVYDIRGRLITESKIIDTETFTTSWAYNSADLPVTMTYPDDGTGSEVLTYGYNSDGTLKRIRSTVNNYNTYLVGDMQYDPAGRLALIQYGLGVINKTFTYFDWGAPVNGSLLQTARATKVSGGTVLQDLSYDYDENGNVKTITDALAGPQIQTFTYDSLSRILSASASGGTNGLYSETYDYDPASGNLSLKADVSYTYDPTHPHAVKTLSNGNEYNYDNNGNMIYRQVNGQEYNLGYDAENRLTSVEAVGVSIIPTITPTLPASLTPTITSTFTQTLTPTASLIPTETSTLVETNTPTETSSATETITPTETSILTDTLTPTETSTSTETSTPENTETPTETVEPTVTETSTAEATVTATETLDPNASATPSETATVEATPTPVLSPTETEISIPTQTETPTGAPASSPTATETGTYTPTPVTPTPIPVLFANASFTYDGDGKRVKSVIQTNYGTTTTHFVGSYYEVAQGETSTQVNKVYYAGAQRIATRKGSEVSFILGDHLGSTSLVTDQNGNEISEMQYTAWGDVRFTSGNMPTKYQYTGQYNQAEFGLYFYNARWYDGSLGRFIQADSIVPGGVQGLDRYAYVNNSPINYIDPTGHKLACGPYGEECSQEEIDAITYVPMSISRAGINHIKDWEGLELQPYNDGVNKKQNQDLFYNRTKRGKGNCTVGWGHLIHKGPCDGSPSEDSFLSITPKQADALLMADIRKTEVEVRKRIKVELTQSQYDAMVSLFFNWNLYDRYPTKVNLINEGRYEEAGIHFLLGPVTSGGIEMDGLKKRRYEEAEMFLRGSDIVLPPLDVYMKDYYDVYEETLNTYFP